MPPDSFSILASLLPLAQKDVHQREGLPEGGISLAIDLMPLRVFLWFDRIYDLLAMLGDLTVPQFEESAHVFVNRHLEIGKLLWHGSDLGQNLDGSPVRVRPINDGSGSHRAFQVAYEQENTGMRIGILPQFNLILTCRGYMYLTTTNTPARLPHGLGAGEHAGSEVSGGG